jgi:hypothetical protein
MARPPRRPPLDLRTTARTSTRGPSDPNPRAADGTREPDVGTSAHPGRAHRIRPPGRGLDHMEDLEGRRNRSRSPTVPTDLQTAPHRAGPHHPRRRLRPHRQIRIIRTPARAPRANTHAERWIGTLHRECLNHLLITGPRHLTLVLRENVEHYNPPTPPIATSTPTSGQDHSPTPRPRDPTTAARPPRRPSPRIPASRMT